MKHLFLPLLVLAALACSSQQTNCCFLVIPCRTEKGVVTKQDVRKFEDYLLDKTGGFTRLGKVKGEWKDPETGEIYREHNTAYLVSSEKDIQEELKAYIEKNFHQKAGYVVKWPVE